MPPLLRPRNRGLSAVSQVDTRLFGPRRTVTTAGSAAATADPREAWAGLLPAGGVPLPATFDEMTGDWILVQARVSDPGSDALRRLTARIRGRGKQGPGQRPSTPAGPDGG